MTFQEYTPQSVRLEPPRNPLREIRVLPFLRGEAYVNPFHDLLSAFSRSAGSKTGPAEPTGGLRVTFHDDKLVVAGGGAQVDGTYEYQDLLKFKLDFSYDLSHHNPNYLAEVAYPTCLKLDFTTERRSFSYRLHSTEYAFRKLIGHLYDRRVAFREFYQGMRSFKLATNIPYRRVQQIKAKYGVEW